jgi:hypothetical protein
MGWKDRVRTEIVFRSPEGNEFRAKWRNDDITISKRVNRQAHPDLDGESAQDLGLNSPDCPITFYFDGADHDTEAARFGRSMAERGLWEVTHPVYGLIKLQPVKITIGADPVTSANVTKISGEWFAPADSGAVFSGVQSAPAGTRARLPDFEPEVRVSTPDPVSVVDSAVADLSTATLVDAGRLQAAVSNPVAARSAASRIRDAVMTVRDTMQTANRKIVGLTDKINNLTMEAYLDIASISGAFIELMQSPGLFIGNIASRIAMFGRLGNRIMAYIAGLAPASGGGGSGVGSAAAAMARPLTAELLLSAVTCGMGTSVTEGAPETRAEAVSALRNYQDFSTRSQAALEAAAKSTAGNPIEKQYFPRPASTEAVLTLNAVIAGYVSETVFNLKTEKRVILERPENPMLLAIREYGANASNADFYFSFLARSNNLHGRELLLLPANKEVILYV